MATWKKDIRKRENGEDVEMQLPEIVSASRSTDIPAFYADWFFYRLKNRRNKVCVDLTIE